MTHNAISIKYAILTTEKYKDRQRIVTKSWAKGLDYVFYSDGFDHEQKCIKSSDHSDYAGAEDKAVNVLNLFNCMGLAHDWYMFCDDDTYICHRNLMNLISQADPSCAYGHLFSQKTNPLNPLFQADPDLSAPCQELWRKNPIRKGIWREISGQFRYFSGGAGYLFSKQVMRQLAGSRSFRTGFSDVSVGLNLFCREIETVHHQGFHPEHFSRYGGPHPNAISYHYIKTPEDYAFLDEFYGSPTGLRLI